jgi:heme exporter protein A
LNTYSLCVTNLSKQFTGILLFKNLSFELVPGEVLAVTGWNGSGKSTLLRIIAGLVKPSTGRVTMFLQDKMISKEMRRRFLGMVAPAFSLYDELTAIENMAFFCRVRGLPYDRESCLTLLERVNLISQTDMICGTYSSGMKQRLKLIQAILHKPPLLLLDEPGSNLDSKGMTIIEDIISEQRRFGMTIIASNETREVDYADRTINLSQ